MPFLWASIGANELDSLSPGKTPRAKLVLEFLRGNQVNEGSSIGQFRVRVGGLLGDIVDSQAIYTGAPRAPYLDANDPGYSTWKTSLSGRPARVYVGANDGMLHVFDDATGNEAWAFVPSELMHSERSFSVDDSCGYHQYPAVSATATSTVPMFGSAGMRMS